MLYLFFVFSDVGVLIESNFCIDLFLFLFFFLISGGVLINIECKAWAHNIRHDRAERRGSVHFELMVD